MPHTGSPRVDLSACATEPIHVPGAIQPHGALLLVQRSGQVLQASANAAEVLRAPAAATPGWQLPDLVDAGGAAALLDAVRHGSAHEGPVRRADGSTLHATCHAVGEMAIVELEPVDDSADDLAAALGEAIPAIATAQDVGALVAACSNHVRRLSGFDRVLVYRFDDDGHGEVVAEDREPGMDPYLGHHYPESDIPRQARALYLRNWIRCIPDATYRPVPLLPTLRPDTGEPLDLSGAHLRSVSPVHLEYLANMGLRASMSVSLVVDGRLWGLVSCGHRTPKAMPAALRRACETIGRLLSLQLAALEATEFHRREAAQRGTLEALSLAMRANSSQALSSLLAEPSLLLPLVGAGGAAVIDAGAVARVGSCPEEADVLEIARHVESRIVDGCFCTRELPREHPALARLAADASGVMAVSLPPDRMLLWFRPQVPHTILWGGNPDKSPRIEIEDGVPRLHPRRSFALWKEEVRGKALPWQPVERHLALQLRRYAMEVDLSHQVASHKAAVRARDELVAVVSHDLRTPVSIVAMQATLIQRFLGPEPAEGSKRLAASALVIRHAADRMTTMLHDLVDLARIESGRFTVSPIPQDAAVLVRESVELMRHLAEARHLPVVVNEPESMYVAADPERIFHVFANLIGNAVKFTPEGGVITVGGAHRDGRCEFYVQDTGRGIPAEKLGHVFERYWQGSRQDQAAGLGLGLYICKGLVAAHGGRIWVESVQGQGTTFRFELPCVPAPYSAEAR